MRGKSKAIIAIFFLLTACGSQPSIVQKQLTINDNAINVEVAQTQEELIQGLSGRQSLENNTGMLFIHFDYKIRNYWMNEMRFPLDIIWIKDNKVVNISKNVPPFTTDNQIGRAGSQLPVNMVLEVSAGLASKYRIKPGDYVYGLD